MKTTREILIGAADLMEHNGKADGTFVQNQQRGQQLRHSPMCAIGAIGYVSCGDPYSLHGAEGAYEALYRAVVGFPLTGQEEGKFSSITTWSDTTDVKTVVWMLRALADEV